MQRVLLFLVAACLLVPSFALAQGGGEGEDRRSPTAERNRDEKRDEDREEWGRGRDKERAGPGVGIGAFGVAEGGRHVAGDFVTFNYSTRGLENVTASGRALFRANATGNASFGAGDRADLDVRSRGSQIRIDTDAYRLHAHDGPNALFQFESAGTFRLEFPEGATLRDAEGYVEVLYPDGETGRVIGGNATVDGFGVVGDDRATFMLDARRGAFDVHRKDIGRAIATRNLGAEVTVGRPLDPGAPIESEVVTFANVTVATDARPGNVTLVVSGHGFDGRVIVLNVDPDLFGSRDTGGLRVLFDNASMRSADDVVDIMDPDDDGLQPEYLLVSHHDGLQLMVSIPHYSVHTLSLTELVQEVPPSIVAGLIGALLVVAAGGFVLFRRPRRE